MSWQAGTGPGLYRIGHMRSEEGERAMAISALRRRLGVLTVRCQALSLLGRLEVLGPGTAAAAGRRWGTGALLEEGAAGRQPGQSAWPHGLPVRICQDGVNHGEVYTSPPLLPQIRFSIPKDYECLYLTYLF